MLFVLLKNSCHVDSCGHIIVFFAEVMNLGAEGVMLRLTLVFFQVHHCRASFHLKSWKNDFIPVLSDEILSIFKRCLNSRKLAFSYAYLIEKNFLFLPFAILKTLIKLTTVHGTADRLERVWKKWESTEMANSRHELMYKFFRRSPKASERT